MEIGQMDNDSRAFETRIDETLSRKNKAFMRVFLITLIFSLTVFFFIFFPYVTSHTARTELLREVMNLGEKRDNAETRILHHKEVFERFNKTLNLAEENYQEMDSWEYYDQIEDSFVEQSEKLIEVKKLLADMPGAQMWIAGKAARPERTSYRTIRRLASTWKDVCYWLEGDMWIRCKIAYEMSKRHKKIQALLGANDKIKMQDFSIRDIRIQLNKIYAPFSEWISKPMDDHRQESNRVKVSFFWGDYKEILIQPRTKLKTIRKSMDEEKKGYVSTIKMRQADIMQAESKLKSVRRLNKIETPIGSLPIGLDDVILAFPFIVALLLYYTIELLNDAIILRKALHIRYQERDNQPKEGVKKYLSMTSPLWLDPVDSPAQSSVKLFSIVIPILVFLMSLWLILDQDFLFNKEVVSAWITRTVIIGFYMYSGYMMISALRRLIRQFYKYRHYVYNN